MIFGRTLLPLLLALATAEAQLCADPGALTCHPVVGDLPVLDGNLSDWADVVGIETSLYAPLLNELYGPGKAEVKCAHSADRIFLTLEIPGKYRFDATSNAMSAAIATMMKIGADATFYNMGGCPDAQTGCSATTGGVPATCETYRVDILHWELATTEQNVTYPINIVDGTGNDLVANKDDEYAVSPYCRLDDDGSGAGNEWVGGWSHSAGTEEGADGTYMFELSRLLVTASTATDAQMTIGETYEFGVAYWDPNQMEEGWSASNHYISGCGRDWFDLVLSSDPYEPNATATPTEPVESCIVEDIECERFMGELPVLDGNISEWSDITGIEIPLYSPLGRERYARGKTELKCAHSEDRLFLTLSVPGKYRFDADSNELCAAIGTMMRIGEAATFYNMGGCPEAAAGCDNGELAQCDAYRVDIGAHWELATTEQGVTYPINIVNGTGNDLVANKDDEYAVSSYCRFDDDGDGAGNEWAGGWSHSAGTEDGAEGNYMFEISRLLVTASTATDAQMKVGKTYDFGVAFWDPYEKEDGWSDSNHYVSGCGEEWFQLTLVPFETDAPTAAPTDSAARKTARKWLASILVSAGVWVMALF
jgi:hypothetical protein